MNNNNREKNEKTIAIGLSLIIICISLLVGTLLFFKLNTLFNSYMESQCARQGKITADAVSQGFRLESEWLDYFAKQVEYGNLSVTDLPELISGGEAGVYVGIIGIDGELIAGDKIDVSKFGSLRATIKGYDTVDYVAGEGLILSCPILHKGNVRYVLYELYDNDAAAYNFSFDTYENYSFCCVTSHESEHVFSLQNVDESWIELMENSKIEDAFNNMARELSVTGFAARSVNIGYGKDFFVYKAEIPDTSLVLFGIVEKKVVNSGIPDIYGLIFWICGILLITLAAAMIYLTKASAKVRQAEVFRLEKEAAVNASKAKSDFLANMSHEIRTPINAVLGLNEMIIRESTEKEIRDYANDIKSAGQTLLGIINDILDFSKIESGKMELVEAPYSLSSLLNDLYVMDSVKVEDKGLELIFNIDPHIPDNLYGDAIRVKQIILNIMNNAVKYTEKGTVTLEAKGIRLNDKREMISFHVRDTGIGIKEEDIPKLFMPFERIEEKRNRNIEGTGLGMNITKHMLSLMGSRLEVKSVYGEGSDFYFNLEQDIVSEDEIGDFAEIIRKNNENAEKYRESFTAPEAKIMIVDDTPMNLTVIKALLKKTQIQIDTADSGKSSIALASGNKYDLIFMDHRMPMMDGTEAMLHIKNDAETAINHDTPVIVLTANAVTGAKAEFLAEGFDNYLSKPVDFKKVEKMLIEYIPREKVKITDDGEDGTEQELSVEEKTIYEKISAIQAIDSETAVNALENISLYISAVKEYTKSADMNLTRLMDDLDRKDFADFTVKVHALKSSSRMIGAAEISKEAEYLEKCGDDARYDEIIRKAPGLLDEYENLTSGLKKIFNSDGDISKSEISEEELSEAYKAILECAEGFDMESADIIIAELDKRRIPDSEAKRFHRLRDYVQAVDYDSVIELLK